MQIPWFRMLMMLALMRQGDEAGAQLAHVAHFALSWGLTEGVTPLARALVLRAQARNGEITLTHARTLGKLRPGQLVAAFGVAAASLAALLATGHTQMPLFLLFTTCVLPLFQAAAYPRAWPAAPLLLGALAAIWAWEGVRPLFVGLLLFQAVPVAQELVVRAMPTRPRLRRLASISLWWAAAAATLPLVLLAFGAMYVPELLFGVLEPAKASAGEAEKAFKAAWASRLDGLTRLLGAGRGPDDPWRVLGLARGAGAREVKKRVRELSLTYHPDKTGGNNPMATARFLQIQAAAERLTRRDAAEDAAKATFEAARDAATRCVECVFVVGIWVGMSALAAVSAVLWPPPQQQQLDAETLAAIQAAQAQQAGGAAAAAPEVRVGPSFMGAGMLGLAPAATLRGAAVAAPLPRVGSAAAAAAAEEAERKAARRAAGGAQQAAAAQQAGPATAAPAAPPQPGIMGAASAFVFGKPKAPAERPMSGKERRAAKRAGDAAGAPAAAAVAEASHPKAA